MLALAYVPNRPLGSLGDDKTILESPGLFEPATATHYQIYHGDLSNHLANCTSTRHIKTIASTCYDYVLINIVIFGEYDAGEHYLVPILKAIDFSEATDSHDEFKGRLRLAFIR